MDKKIPGVGKKTEELLKKMNINTVNQLIELYPRCYKTYDATVDIKNADGVCAIKARTMVTPVANGKTASITVRDDCGDDLKVIWFHLPAYLYSIKRGTAYIFYGQISEFKNKKQMVQPVLFTEEEYQILQSAMQPIYPLTAGITQNTMRKIVRNAINVADIYDNIPQCFRKKYNFIDKAQSINTIHYPTNKKELDQAVYRLKYEELFSFIYELRKLNEKNPNNCILKHCKIAENVRKSLPFELTKGQKNAWEDIKKATIADKQMSMLVQGDVGCGKTIVAFLSMILAAENGYQAALMAPTEVLAVQHYEDMTELIKKSNLKYNVVLITGSTKKKECIYKKIEDGDIQLVIGTHAIMQDSIIYKNLGMIITDEQHRFGVKQRDALEEKGNYPHHIVMSATPIPRSLALVIYGDMDISIIKERPANRLPIKNCVIERKDRIKAWRFLYNQIKNGRQGYVICPMVEDNKDMDVASVTEYVKQMQQVFPDNIKIGLLHGKSKDKDEVMDAFFKNEIQILVSTTVVEVGVNVPNSTVMIIEDANRFGLSQLHQLRGRVGRGSYQSFCIFINGNNEPCERLKIMAESNDGFKIAEEDMRLRGIGDVFGVKQSGDGQFKLVDLYEDAELLKTVGKDVDELLSKS